MRLPATADDSADTLSPMKVLFLNPEQYLSCDLEPSWYELRMPILKCGVVTEQRDFVYQRLVREEGHESMQRQLLEEVEDFHPDLVVYSTTSPEYSIEPWVLRWIMDGGVPIYTHLWDTNSTPRPHELDSYLSCNYMGETGSVSNYLFYKSLAPGQKYLQDVVFTAGHNVFTDLFKREDLPKAYDVTLIGSREGIRRRFINFLENHLTGRGYVFNKAGGLVDSTRIEWHKGLRLSDDWIPWADYVREINRSKICVSSQSDPGRTQVKGKVFHYLACGAMVLTDRNFEICKIVPDECVVYYDDFEDCLEKAVYYLENESERRAIADRGHAWFHRTFDYKKFWSAVVTRAVTGSGPLPGLPGDALHRERSWTAEVCDLKPEGSISNASDTFAPLVLRGVEPRRHPGHLIPWKKREPVSCSLPWSKLEIGPNGEYGPCCHYKVGDAPPPASKAELGKLWNSKGMRAVRQNLLDGKLAGTPCETCYDRMFSKDHDIFGMGRMPRYSLPDARRDAVWLQANKLYEDGRVLLPNLPIEINVDHALQDTGRMFALLGEMGFESFDRLSWGGGETPLSHNGIELLNHVAQSDPGATCVCITTNGTDLDKHLGTLEQIENLFLTVGIDGAGANYEAVAKSGSWRTLCDNLELLREARDRHPNWRLNIHSVVMKSTYRDIEELIDLADRIGASIFFMPINGASSEEDFFCHPELLRDPEVLVKAVENGIAKARALGAEKARDSLEKLLEFWAVVQANRRDAVPETV